MYSTLGETYKWKKKIFFERLICRKKNDNGTFNHIFFVRKNAVYS